MGKGEGLHRHTTDSVKRARRAFNPTFGSSAGHSFRKAQKTAAPTSEDVIARLPEGSFESGAPRSDLPVAVEAVSVPNAPVALRPGPRPFPPDRPRGPGNVLIF